MALISRSMLENGWVYMMAPISRSMLENWLVYIMTFLDHARKWVDVYDNIYSPMVEIGWVYMILTYISRPMLINV